MTSAVRHRLLMVLVACAVVLAGCTSSPSTLSLGNKLETYALPPPDGYQADTSSQDAVGIIPPQDFPAISGISDPTKAGFRVGYKVDYVDYSTEEGIAVLLLQFSSAKEAQEYLNETLPYMLSEADPTHKSYVYISGAYEVDATKVYAGDFSHAMVMTKNDVYAQLVYSTSGPEPLPVEFYSWAKAQWSLIGTNLLANQ